jgi:hypothetical protein
VTRNVKISYLGNQTKNYYIDHNIQIDFSEFERSIKSLSENVLFDEDDSSEDKRKKSLWLPVLKLEIMHKAIEHQAEILNGKTIIFDMPWRFQPTKGRLSKVTISHCIQCNKIFTRVSKNIIKNTICHDCKKEYARDLQRVRRNTRVCLYCRKLLPKEFPNRKYCSGGACRAAAYRVRKRKRN